jgi:DNA repair protein RadC
MVPVSLNSWGARAYLKAMLHQRAETAVALAGVEASKAFFAPCFSGVTREQLWVAHLDHQARCIHLASYQGDEQQVDLPVREIIRDAAQLGSAGVVLAHNHPSGDSRPSPSDTQATRKLATAAEALDVTVLDHLIFAGPDCTSMRRMGLL